MLWLCLHFHQLPVEVFTRGEANPGPVAVIEKHRVLHANAAARQHGVTAGTSTSTAQALCGALRVLERQPAREAALLQGLADWAYRFTPMLSLAPPHGLLLEISGSLRLYGGLPALLRRATAELRERAHAHAAGIAPTPTGAELLSRAAPCDASNLPGWLDAADGSGYRACIAGLPIAWLDCPEALQKRLRQPGFRHIGELLELPRAACAKRFGQDFLARLLRLTGELPDPRRRHQPPVTFHAGIDFPEPVPDTAMLLFPMRRLLGELDQFLERRQSHCQRLVWRFSGSRQPLPALGVQCSLEHNSRSALLELTRLQLERLRLAEPVTAIALACRHFAPVRQGSTVLFRELEETGAESDRLLIDRLQARLGAGRVHGIRRADAHIPEQASTNAPAGTPPAAADSGAAARPCWLLPAPLPLELRRDALCWQGRVRLLGSPERIEGGWWSGEGIAREYFVAQHENGTLCWVFRERDSRRWFLHGLFG